MVKPKLKLLEVSTLDDLEDTAKLARKIATMVTSRQVIGLQGDMGSGKTHFVKAMASALGIKSEETNSPTFAIHQQYSIAGSMLHHFDLFRLESVDDIESSGFWDIFYEENVLIMIEWIDRIHENQLPQNFAYLRLDWEIHKDGRRKVTLWQRLGASSKMK
jgi:tRNA threonylcarbamoyladenosine biosynthesis protein TsaE